MPESVPRVTRITAARLLDGSGAAPVDHAGLLIEGERVVGLGAAAEVRPPDGASVERQDYGETEADLAAMTGEAHRHGKLAGADVDMIIQAADCVGAGGRAARLLPGRQAGVLAVRRDPPRQITAPWDVLDACQAGRRGERGVH